MEERALRTKSGMRLRRYDYYAAARWIEADPGSGIHPDVAPLEGDVIVTKKRVSAFIGSDLVWVLRSLDTETLVVTGLATGGVVLSMIRQAADVDYRMTVLKGLCADPDPEIHQVLMKEVLQNRPK